MEGCISTGGKQKECAGTPQNFKIPQETSFEIIMLSLRFGGEVVLDKPLSQREEYLRQMKVLFYSFEYEPSNSLEILILSVKAKADQPEGGVQEAVAEPEGRVLEAAGEEKGGEERKEDEKESCIQLLLLLVIFIHLFR